MKRAPRSRCGTEWKGTAAYLGDEQVRPQAGNFYGGWITDKIEGPFKGDPGTEGW